MWPPIYQCFESHSCLYTEFTVAGEEKCMLNSASANTVQGIQGACTTSPSFSKIQKCIHTLDKSRQSITGHSNWFIQNRPLPVQSERIPRYALSLSSFIPVFSDSCYVVMLHTNHCLVHQSVPFLNLLYYTLTLLGVHLLKPPLDSEGGFVKGTLRYPPQTTIG